MARLIVANLLAEEEWALASGRRRGAAAVLPANVRARLTRLATTLRVFADDGDDLLWIPEAVEPEAIAVVEGLARPRLETGSLDTVDLEGVGEILAWGETPSVTRMRARCAQAHGTSLRARSAQEGGSGFAKRAARPSRRESIAWIDALANLPPPEAHDAARANDRVARMALRGQLGEAHGARRVKSLAELDAATESLHARDARWVLKAPFSAAGRERVLGRGRLDDAAQRPSAERLLARWGELVFEPWRERTRDHAWGGILDADGRLVHHFAHDLQTRGPGNVVAVEIDGLSNPGAGARTNPGAEPDGGPARIREAVVASLHAEGYRGAFVVDGFDYLDEEGRERSQRLVEINARVGFGLVAHALRARIERVAGRVRRFTLCLSGAEMLAEIRRERPDARVVELLAPRDGLEGPWVVLE